MTFEEFINTKRGCLVTLFPPFSSNPNDIEMGRVVERDLEERTLTVEFSPTKKSKGHYSTYEIAKFYHEKEL